MKTTAKIGMSRKPSCRKRASKACLKCRKRKVRCDVTRTAQPCTNCRLDGAECMVITKENEPVSVDRSCDGLDAIEANLFSQLSGDIPSVSLADIVRDWSTGGDFQAPQSSQGHLDNESSLNWQPDAVNLTSNMDGFQSQTALADQTSIFTESNLMISDPWMKWSDENSRPLRVKHLESHACFHVPAEPLLSDFLRHYFLFVHPMLPMLHEGEFWDKYEKAGSSGGCDRYLIPVVLLQAMLFATCAFVPEQTLQLLGFENALAAKACFYERAKLLYESNSKLDHVPMAQSALLLTYWCPPGSGQDKANSSWLRAAIRHAKAVNAHKYADQTEGTTAKEEQPRKVLKELWWCCIIRDRIMPLCVRRDIQISRREFDFDTHKPLNAKSLADEISQSKVYSVEEKTLVTTMTALMTELCVSLTDVLGSIYPISDHSALDARGLSAKLKQARDSKKALRTWLRRATQSSSVFANLRQVQHVGLEPSSSSIILFANLLWIYYHSAIVALCNHELHLVATATLTQKCINVEAQLTMIDNTRRELRNASTGITDSIHQLLHLGLTKWMPGSAVGCTALPLALHMLDAKLGSTFDPNSSANQNRLNMLIQTMKDYYPKHEGVVWISKIIRYFMECTYLDEPLSDWDPLIPKGPESVDGCAADVIRRTPTRYLKMALTLDLSLSNDRLPEEQDFPAGLRALVSRTGCFLPILFRDDQIMEDMDGGPSPEPEPSWGEPPPALLQDVSGWIENDRSLYFALEMGLGPQGLPDFGGLEDGEL